MVNDDKRRRPGEPFPDSDLYGDGGSSHDRLHPGAWRQGQTPIWRRRGRFPNALTFRVRVSVIQFSFFDLFFTETKNLSPPSY
jgi:hypothetical protein